MGIKSNDIKFLLFAKKLGADFKSTASIGRQNLFVDRYDFYRDIHRIFPDLSYAEMDSKFDQRDTQGVLFAEPLFHLLGAEEIESFDNSDYEGATIIHDFNLPLRANKKFTTLFDGGSLEHIFNYPVAIQNCMELIADQGFFISINPSNNYFGHGFYQFSPDLYYSVLSEINGFSRTMVFINDGDNNYWYVIPPSSSHIRNELEKTDMIKTSIFVISQKTGKIPNTLTVQQSDYEVNWTHQETVVNTQDSKLRALPIQKNPGFRHFDISGFIEIDSASTRKTLLEELTTL